MAEAVVSIALETLRDQLLEEGRLLSGVSREVRTLEAQLKEIRYLLKDAESKQHDSDTVCRWIKEIRDLSYRAEDAIELYAAVQGSSSRRGHSRLKQLFRRCSCILKEGFSLHQIGNEISLIKSDMARVTRSMQEFGIRDIIEGESSAADALDINQQWTRRTFPFETRDVFVGKDQELEQLVSLVIDDEKHPVVSIWGMGGIGKTTLARKVYNHYKAKRFFESFAWICVSQQCQIRSVLENVLKQLNPHHSTYNLSDTELIGQLCEIQKAKRCIVVIDDIWKIGHWEGLKHAFLLRGTKSKILLTTRKQSVANIGYAFKAGLLNENDGWELLKNKAFPHTNIPDFPFEEKLLQEIGKEMVGKCGKLPLAISLLGGILSNKKSMREWELVNENITAYLYRGEGLENEKDGIYGVLNLSYQDLPYYLKSCFLYMGRYDEDELIAAKDLCLIWIAQGMISYENQPNEESLMSIAQHYLSELASRCIVEILEDDPIRGQTHTLCKLHDVVRELCLSMGKAEDFGLQILNYEGGKFSSLLHECLSRAKTRHLVVKFEREIDLHREREECRITCDEDATKLVRSLHFSNRKDNMRIVYPYSLVDLKKFRLLKDLVFWRINFERRKLPTGVGTLIHLRKLCLIACEVDELPSSISNLVYMHTLNLRFSENIRIRDNVLNRMFRIKHLCLPSYNVEEIGSYRLRLEGLDELETLTGFNSLVHQFKSLIGMKNLRQFEGVVHDNKSLSEIILHVVSANRKNLKSCGLVVQQDCQLSSSEEDLMNFKKLFTCSNLHNLHIHVPIGKLLQELGNQVYTSNLVSLNLEKCEIEEDPMETLGKLLVLGKLHFKARSFVGEEMTCHPSGFPRLTELVLRELPNLRGLRVGQGAMPLVSRIVFNGCPRFEMIPDGFIFLVALTELFVIDMPELGKRVSEEGGEDFHKVRHVPYISILYSQLS